MFEELQINQNKTIGEYRTALGACLYNTSVINKFLEVLPLIFLKFPIFGQVGVKQYAVVI